MVLCQLELPLETLRSHRLRSAREAGVPVMLDPAPAASLPDEVWSRLTWFTPNETEAAFYLGDRREPESAAKELLARGLKGVVLKRGAEGSYVSVANGEAAWVPAFSVEAVDTVAAGDCFNGAFAVALLEGQRSVDGGTVCRAAAAISVTRRRSPSVDAIKGRGGCVSRSKPLISSCILAVQIVLLVESTSLMRRTICSVIARSRFQPYRCGPGYAVSCRAGSRSLRRHA